MPLLLLRLKSGLSLITLLHRFFDITENLGCSHIFSGSASVSAIISVNFSAWKIIETHLCGHVFRDCGETVIVHEIVSSSRGQGGGDVATA
jgi:hypothetical protein